MPSDKYINEDTYQTLQDIKIEPQSNFEKRLNPYGKRTPDNLN